MDRKVDLLVGTGVVAVFFADVFAYVLAACVFAGILLHQSLQDRTLAVIRIVVILQDPLCKALEMGHIAIVGNGIFVRLDVQLRQNAVVDLPHKANDLFGVQIGFLLLRCDKVHGNESGFVIRQLVTELLVDQKQGMTTDIVFVRIEPGNVGKQVVRNGNAVLQIADRIV